MSGLLETLSSPSWWEPVFSPRAGRTTLERHWKTAPNPDSGRLLDQDLFNDALLRERERAERYDQAFLLVEIRNTNNPASATAWRKAADALAAVTRDTDVLGWIEQGAALGLILPELDEAHARSLRGVDGRVRQELAARLGLKTLGGFSVRLHAHSAFKDTARTTARDAAKRAMDVAGSLGMLVLLAPVLLVVAVLVKLTSAGPVLFRQARVGRWEKPFMMLKFRTMHVNADEVIHQRYVTEFIKASLPVSVTGDGAIFKIANDPRVTPIGNFLRKTSLDELPQFWNVLRGEMSLVGPRPPLPYEVRQYQRWHRRRVLDATPGITGLWQVTGRSRTTFDEMVRLDLQYARTRSIWMDIRILLATPGAVFSCRGAR